MKKIFIVVEGETEARFVRRLLYNDFIARGIYVEAQQWVTNRKLGTAGGGGSFDLIENHLRRLMSRYQYQKDVFITVMIDLYAFPKSGKTVYDNDVIKQRTGKDKALTLQSKMKERFQYDNFIPYVQLHEFETLLLSKPEDLLHFYINKEREVGNLINEIKGLNPEEINETADGAPSRRIIRYLPEYQKQKTTAGVITAEKIGLSLLRTRCPHFNDWINTLESL